MNMNVWNNYALKTELPYWFSANNIITEIKLGKMVNRDFRMPVKRQEMDECVVINHQT